MLGKRAVSDGAAERIVVYVLTDGFAGSLMQVVLGSMFGATRNVLPKYAHGTTGHPRNQAS